MRHLVAVGLSALACLWLAGCDDPGRLRVAFDWQVEPEQTVWIWARVEERSVSEQPGRILASVGPVQREVGAEVPLPLDGVTNGDHRVVIIEVREGSNPNLRVAWYGISEPFTMAPGASSTVEVMLPLNRPVGDLRPASMSLLFDGQPQASANLAQIQSATVAFEASGVERVVLANDPSFSAESRLQELALADLGCTDEERAGEDGQTETWQLCQVPGWDMTEGLGTLADEQQSVFMKLVDGFGYESDIYRASVRLDTTPPLVLTASLSAPFARAGQQVQLVVSLTEVLADSGVGLRVSPVGPGTPEFSGPTRVEQSTTYVWTTTTGTMDDQQAYTFELDAADPLGNTQTTALVAEGGAALELRVDGLAPALDPRVVPAPAQLEFGDPALGGASGELAFDFAMVERSPPANVAGGGDCSGGGCPVVLVEGQAVGTVTRASSLDGPEGPDGASWGFHYSYPVDPADWGPGFQQDVSLAVQWVDRAGNDATAALAPVPYFDFVAPGLVALEVAPPIAKVGDPLAGILTASEGLSAAPEVVLRHADSGEELSMKAVSAEPGSGFYNYLLPVTDAMAAGLWKVSPVTLRDRVGNQASPDPLREVRVDASAPKVSNLLVEPAQTDETGTLTVTFDVDELLLKGGPSVTLGGRAVDCGLPQPGSPRFTCTYEMGANGPEIPEGSQQAQILVVEVEDLAGNRDTASTPVLFDFKDPSAECALSPSGRPIALGESARLTVLVDETLDSVGTWPQLTADGAAPSPQTQGFGSTYTWPPFPAGEVGELHWSVAIEDTAHNHVPVACSGSIAYDTQVPTIVAGSVEQNGLAFKQGDTATIGFVVSEVLTTEPVVRIGQQPAQLLSGSDGLSWVFARTIGPEDGAGVKQVYIQLQDEAGNITNDETSAQPLRLDFEAPVLVGLEAAPLSVKAGTVVKLVLTASEKLVSAPALVFETEGGGTLEASATGGDAPSISYVYHLPFPAGTPDGSWTLRPFQMEDLVGNSAEDAEHPIGLSVDASVPTISGLEVGPTRLAAGDLLTATFDVAETLAGGTLTASVGSRNLACGEHQPGSPNRTCTLEIVGDEIASGSEEGEIVVIDAVDQAGNRDTRSRTVVFDFKPPTADCDVSPAGRPVGIGEAFRLTAVVSEAMADGWQGVSLQGFGTASLDSSGFSTERALPVVQEGQTGSFTWAVALEDVAGNTATPQDPDCAGVGTVDGVRPTILPGTVVQAGTRFRAGEVASFAFDASEPLASAPVVRIGQQLATASTVDGTTWTFEHTFAAAEGSGVKQITVTLVDEATNETLDSQSFEALTLDLDAPVTVGLEAAPLAVQAGTEVKIVLTANETLASAPLLGFELAGEPALVPVAGQAGAQKNSYVYTLAVPAGTADGTYALQPFELVDLAGNAVTDAEHPVELVVDASVPFVSGLVVSPQRLSETGLLTASFDVAEPLPPGGLNVTVGGRSMTCGDYAALSPNYLCTRAMVGDEVAAGEEAAQIVLVDAVDVAGNRDAASATAVFDFKDPLATCYVSPIGRPARLGETARLVINVDEAQAAGFPQVDDGGVAPDSVQTAGFTTTLSLLADTEGIEQTFQWPVALQDIAGNAVPSACDLSKVTLAVDTIKPAVQPGSVALSGTSFKAGDTVTLSFDVSEPLAHEPSVLVGDQPATLSFGDGTSFTFQRTFGASDTSGTRQVAISLEDVAGNTSTDVQSVSAVVLDVDPPTATCTLSPSQRPVGLGEELRLVVNYSEPLAAGFPALDGAPELVLDSSVGFSATFIYKEGDKNVEKSLAWTVALEDLAGNATPIACTGAADVDTRLPKLVSGTFDVSSRLLRGDQTLLVGFTVSEPLAQLPVVSVGTLPMVPLDPSATGPTYAYALGPLQTVGLEEGSHALGIGLLDEAHNAKVITSADLGSITADYSAPNLVGFDVSPAVANDTDGITVVLTADEALGTIPTVTATHSGSGHVLSLPAQSTVTGKNSYVYRGAEGTSLDDGAWTFDAVTLVDAAGNSAVRQASAQVVIDTSIPTLSGVTATPATTTADGVVTVTAHTDEAPDEGGLRGTLGGVSLACTYDATPAADPNITCTHDLATAGPSVAAGNEVDLPIALTVVDEAGNAGVGSASVRVDFRAPAVAAATVTYAPGVGNPVSAPTAARVGTTVKAVIAADEPVDATGAAPTLTLTAPGGGTLSGSASSVSAAGDLVLFNLVLPALDEQGAALESGTWTGVVTWADPYGNAGDAGHPDLSVEVLNSEPTLEVDQGLVTAVRSPWGNSASESLGAATIPAGTWLRITPADSLSPSDTLPESAFTLSTGEPATVVRFWPDAAQSVLLGTALPTSGGWPRTALAAFDTATVFVTGLDGAGNESGPVGLRNMVWVATPRPLKTGTNPNTVTARPRTGSPDSESAPRSAADDAATGGLDGAVATVTADPVWEQLSPGVDWSPLGAPADAAPLSRAAAFDGARGVLVFWDAGEATLREFDPLTGGWSAPTTEGAVPRPDGVGQAMAWDAGRGRVVMFGGLAGKDAAAEAISDMLEWDGETWTDVTTADGPPGRSAATLVYDGARRELLLFGGSDGDGQPLGDLWAWDGGSWAERTPAGPSPSARSGAAAAFDAARSVVVLIGGDGAGGPLSDVWEWDGSTWTQRAVGGGPAPSLTVQPRQAAVDAPGAGVYLLADAALWRWTGSAWNSEGALSGPLAGAEERSLSLDPVTGVLYVVGEDGVDAGRLWSWDGSRWRGNGLSQADGSLRRKAAAAWDDTRGELVVHGGTGAVPGELSDLTYVFDGFGWRIAAQTGPGARMGHAMAFDESSGKMILFGGADASGPLADTWLWDGMGWQEVPPPAPPAPTQPAARMNHAMVWDPVAGRVMMTGGESGATVYQETWAWNGMFWQPRPPPPQAVTRHAMTWSTGDGHVLSYGGDGSPESGQGTMSTPKDGLWRWLAAPQNQWQVVSPGGTSPPARAGIMLADLPVWEQVLMLGGDGGGVKPYVWDASAGWSGQSLSGAVPLIAEDGRAVYDPLRERVVMTGVSEVGEARGHMELDVSSWRQPAVELAVIGAASGFSAAEVVGMTVRAWCGGDAWPSGAATEGAVLEAFSVGGAATVPGTWVELDTGTASLDDVAAGAASAALSWTAPGADAARDLIRSRDLALGLRCRSVGTTGAGTAHVAADYLEVRLSYQPLEVTCGDGTCDPGESSATCLGDCP
ncbi:MAG: hypothetical protein H6744_20175 [Deltaproteobacteria bacterium]|nr:hypothetical protein [Deltaproteobacteria bacterium]